MNASATIRYLISEEFEDLRHDPADRAGKVVPRAPELDRKTGYPQDIRELLPPAAAVHWMPATESPGAPTYQSST
jgi:hypothetical protein